MAHPLIAVYPWPTSAVRMALCPNCRSGRGTGSRISEPSLPTPRATGRTAATDPRLPARSLPARVGRPAGQGPAARATPSATPAAVPEASHCSTTPVIDSAPSPWPAGCLRRVGDAERHRRQNCTGTEPLLQCHRPRPNRTAAFEKDRDVRSPPPYGWPGSNFAIVPCGAGHARRVTPAWSVGCLAGVGIGGMQRLAPAHRLGPQHIGLGSVPVFGVEVGGQVQEFRAALEIADRGVEGGGRLRGLDRLRDAPGTPQYAGIGAVRGGEHRGGRLEGGFR